MWNLHKYILQLLLLLRKENCLLVLSEIYFLSTILHFQADLLPRDRHVDNLKWQWDKFHFVVNCLFNYSSPLYFFWLTQTRLLLWQGSLTSRLKYANYCLPFHLDWCQIHWNYKKILDLVLHKMNIFSYFCHLLLLSKPSLTWCNQSSGTI